MPESAAEDLETLGNQAVFLQSSGHYQEALECLLTLLPRFPRHAQLLSNLGVLYRETGELARSEGCLRQACSLRPDNAEHHFNLAITLLLAGATGEGFAEYEWRWRVGALQEQRSTFAQPLWDGAPLDGRRILLYAEQGAGDSIHFVRYAPLVRAAGGQVILEVLPALEPLLWWMPGRIPDDNPSSPRRVRRPVSPDEPAPSTANHPRFDSPTRAVPGPSRSAPALDTAVAVAARRKLESFGRVTRVIRTTAFVPCLPNFSCASWMSPASSSSACRWARNQPLRPLALPTSARN